MYFKAVSALCLHRKESLVLDLRPQLPSAGSLQPCAQAEVPYMGKKEAGLYLLLSLPPFFFTLLMSGRTSLEAGIS